MKKITIVNMPHIKTSHDWYYESADYEMDGYIPMLQI